MKSGMEHTSPAIAKDLRNVVANQCAEDSPKNILPKVEKAF